MPHNSDCGVCKVEVVGGDRAVACSNCDDWYHTACTDISKSLYKKLDSPNVLWICTKCVDIVNKTFSKNREDQKASILEVTIDEPRKDVKIKNDKIQSINNNKLEIMVDKNITGETIGVLINGTTSPDKLEDWKIVTNKRGRVQKAAFREPELKIKNKYSILADEPNLEKETVLIGDSIVRNQCIYFGKKNLKAKRRVECYGGIKLKSTIDIIKGLKLKDKNSSMIVHVGSNDVFSDSKVNVEVTINNYSILIDKIKEKSINGMVVGILPRLRVPNEKNRMAQMINAKVKTLCNSKGIKFVNFWDSYKENWNLYTGDGVHLSKKGKGKLGDLINLNLYNLLSKSGNYQREQKEKIG